MDGLGLLVILRLWRVTRIVNGKIHYNYQRFGYTSPSAGIASNGRNFLKHETKLVS